jgi:FtsH-binding integral membrane protein
MKVSLGKWLPLAIWTLLLWTSRIKNILQNSDLTYVAVSVRVLVALIFLVLALLTVRSSLRKKENQVWLTTLCLWSLVYWPVRGGLILIDSQYSIGFKTVHTALMTITLGLVAVALPSKNLAQIRSKF